MIFQTRMIRNFVFLAFTSISVSTHSQAQGFYDTAPRFGQNSIFGSTKSMGMGGVQMGVGGEGSAQAVNPAAPGLMRKSEIQFSLMPYLNTTSNTFRDGTVSADKSGMPVGNFSLSLTTLKTEDEENPIRAGVFTVSYNRVSVFHRKTVWEGETPLYQNNSSQPSNNSIIDLYLAGANKPGSYPSQTILSDAGGNPIVFNDNFKNDLVMAYSAYLLDTSGGSFVSAFPRSDLLKTGYYDQTLNHGMWNFGYSVNIKEKTYLGVSVGYVRGNYTSEVQYGETIQNVYVDPSNPNFSYLQGFKGVNFQLYKNLDQKQVGVNANVGVVYKFSDEFRVSGAIQLPSLTWISEKYSPSITYDFNGLRDWNDPTKTIEPDKVTWFENSFAYKLRMPAKFRGGFNWIAGKTGMLGVDVEYTDLSTTKLTEGDGGYNFVSENKIIQNTYKPTLNVKAGGELRSGDYRFRLGFAYYPTALKSGATYSNNVLKDTFYYTGGIGARFESWYWDIALVLGYSGTDYNYLPATIDQGISTKISNSQLRFGIGFIL